MASRSETSREAAEAQAADAIVRFYLEPRDGGRNLYEIWEEGEAYRDSITPAAYCTPYRQWIGSFIESQLQPGSSRRVLSLGCGNAFVERDLVEKGCDVLGLDLSEAAVELAREKGVPAIVADVRTWEPGSPWDVVYADGLFGHLYSPADGLRRWLARVRGWLGDGGVLVVSSDTPPDRYAEEAPGVPGFYWLSAECVVDELEAAGYAIAGTETFSYLRPLSGSRTRSIVTGRPAA